MPGHPILLDVIFLIILDEEYKLRRFSLAAFSNFLSLHLSAGEIFSSVPFTQTPSVCVHPLM
jgi:hypothetical protein